MRVQAVRARLDQEIGAVTVAAPPPAANLDEQLEAAQTSTARFVSLEPAQESVRQALQMYRKFRDSSFAMLGPKGQLQFDALEPLTVVQALNQSRTLYLQQVVEYNRSQFRLYTALGQPALCGVDAAAQQRVSVPVVPTKPAPVMPLPNPQPVP